MAATSAGHAYPPTAAISNLTIFDNLEAHNISWKVYAVDPKASTPEPFPTFTQHPTKIVPAQEFFTDLQQGTLPSVGFIDTGFMLGTDEHAPSPIQAGAMLVSQFMNALLGSAYWKDSVFIVTHDEGGGFYDHVPPVPAVSPDRIPPNDLLHSDINSDFTITGFRVPLMVASSFTKAHYVPHTPADYTAILKFIETRLGLPSLTARDAAQPDMSEFFDFQGAPWPCYFTSLP